MTTDTVLQVGTINLNVSGTTNAVESISVTPSNFVAAMSGGSIIMIVSNDRYTLSSDAPGAYVSSDCTSSYSLLKINVPTGTAIQNITVTPTPTVACGTATASNSRSSGGGGGGGGSSAPVTVAASVVSVPTTTFAPSVSTAATPQSIWTRDLSRGSQGSDVMALQSFLASNKKIYPEGQITGLYGPATVRAVKKFQAMYGLPSVGTVGPATRVKLAEVYIGGAGTTMSAQTTTTTSSVTTSGTVSFNRSLYKGMSGADVKALQVILNSDPDTRIATTGSGSSGNESTNFGSLTAAAVGKFQVKYGLSAPGQAGYGIVGTKTRAQLNQLAK